MSNAVRKSAATILITASLVSLAAGASAAPVTDALAIKRAAPGNVEDVRWWGWGWPLGAFAAGAVIGGALAARPYYYYPYYYPGPAYYPPPPGYYPGPGPGYAGPGYAGPGGDPVAYCRQRFKSYDPGTGTYLGIDGTRHHCP
jgi:hypothetical protein